MRRLALLATLPLAVAACSGGGADADADGEITAGEAQAEMQEGPAIAMEPGQWEQSVAFTELDMPGAPEAVLDMMRQSMTATVTSQSCLSPEDVAQPDAEFFAGEGNGNCTYEEFDRAGSHIRMRMSCSGDGATNTIAMDGDFGATQYAFDVSTQVQRSGGEAMTMKGTVTAKRVGECPG